MTTRDRWMMRAGLVGLALVVIGLVAWRPEDRVVPVGGGAIGEDGRSRDDQAVARDRPDYADDPLVGGLNAVGGSGAQELAVVAAVLDAWRLNFPREGNPVGENREITAALTGRNRLGLALIPKDHPAINAAGELCDRWGTPLFFHQISGEHMVVRSAGADRRFYTDDDVESESSTATDSIGGETGN
jgi:hypothetical protein